MKEKKYLEICLQHENEVRDAIKFNKEHNYEYIIVDRSNLIGLEGLQMLLIQGYKIDAYADRLTLYPKEYDYERENIKEEL